jgi:surfactin synthase thioesterase subunit
MQNQFDTNAVKFPGQQYKIRKRGSRDIEVYVSTIKKRVKPVIRGK